MASQAKISSYKIFGFAVSCDLNLHPCPKTKSKDTFKIYKKKGEILKPIRVFHTIRYPNHKIYAQFARCKDGHLVIFPRQGTFEISKNGKHIGYEISSNLSDKEKLILIAHHLLPLLLSLNGFLVLHGAAVTKNSKVHLILGSAGLGKSTMSHFLYRQKFRVISDDAVLVKKDGKQFYIYGSTPIIRVWKGKSKALFKTAQRGEQNSRSKLYAIHFPYLSRKRSEPKPISALRGFENLLPHIFRVDVESKSLAAKEFKIVSELSSSIAMYSWPYCHTAPSLQRTKDWLVKLSRKP